MNTEVNHIAHIAICVAEIQHFFCLLLLYKKICNSQQKYAHLIQLFTRASRNPNTEKREKGYVKM